MSQKLTLQEGFDYLNWIINKNQRGNSISPSQYQLQLKSANLDMFDIELKKLLSIKAVPFEVQNRIFQNSPLKRFTVQYSHPNDDGNRFDLPADFEQPNVQNAVVTIDNKPVIRPLDIVSEEYLQSIQLNFVARDLVKNPVAVIRGSDLIVVGKNIIRIDLVYFRLPVIPVYDYCIGANDKVIYMPIGSHLVWQTTPGPGGETITSLIDKEGATIATNISKIGWVPGTNYVSQTIELEWDASFHIPFFHLILSRMGLPIRDIPVIQWSDAKRKEVDV
jgi:hypothetical protein